MLLLALEGGDDGGVGGLITPPGVTFEQRPADTAGGVRAEDARVVQTAGVR